MGLFFNYKKTGSGVDKNAPQKGGIVLFFERFFRHFWKIMEVNLLHFLFMLPAFLAYFAFYNVSGTVPKLVVTGLCLIVFAMVFGPATTGVFKIMRNLSIAKHSFIIRDFKKGFTESYKKSLAVGIVNIIVAVSVFAAIKVYPQIAETTGSDMIYIMLVLNISLAIAVLMFCFYIYLMIAVTDISMKNIIRNAIVLTVVEIKKNLLTLLFVLLIGGTLGVLTIFNIFTAVAFPFIPAAMIIFIICFNCYPVLKKYVIDPYYEKIGEKNPDDEEWDADPLFQDMGGKEKPIDNTKKGKKGRTIS